MNRDILRNQIRDLTNMFLSDVLPNFDDYSISNVSSQLNLIVSDSRLAISYIIFLEDELNVEIDDDDISLEFFKNVEIIIDAIIKYRNQNR